MGNEIERILEQASEHRNAGGDPNSYLLPEHGSGKNDVMALSLRHGWQQQTINIQTTSSPPVNPINVQLFQFIQAPGIIHANGSVLFPDTNPALGAFVTAVQSTYVALRNQTSNRAMRVHYVRMKFSDTVNQLGLPFQWIRQDTFGDGRYYIFNQNSYLDPWQQQANTIDIPCPSDHSKERNLVREDSGYNITINPNQSLSLTFFYSSWNSAAHDMTQTNAQKHGAM